MKNFYIKKENKFCVIETSSTILNMLSIAQYLKEHESISFSSQFDESIHYLEQFGQWKKTKNVQAFSLEVLSFKVVSELKENQKENIYTLHDIQKHFQEIKKLTQVYKFITQEVLKHKALIEKIKVKSFKSYFDYEKQLNDFLMESKRKQLQLTQTEFNKSLIVDVLSFTSWKKNKIELVLKNWMSILNDKGEPLVYEMVKPMSSSNQNVVSGDKVLKEDISLEELSLMAQKIMKLSTDKVLHQKLEELIHQKTIAQTACH